MFKEPFTWRDFMFFLNPAIDMRYFLCDVRAQYGPKMYFTEYFFHSIEEIPIKGFPVCVFCIIWEYQCAKIIVASLLLLTVSYLKVYSYDWIGITTQKLSPNFLEKGL